MPVDFNTETEEDYFNLLKSKQIGKALTNISEYLLETEGMQGQSKVKFALLVLFVYNLSESSFLV